MCNNTVMQCLSSHNRTASPQTTSNEDNCNFFCFLAKMNMLNTYKANNNHILLATCCFFVFNKGKGSVPVHAVGAYTGNGDVAPLTKQFSAYRHVYSSHNVMLRMPNDRYSQQPNMTFITQPHTNSGALHITLSI